MRVGRSPFLGVITVYGREYFGDPVLMAEWVSTCVKKQVLEVPGYREQAELKWLVDMAHRCLEMTIHLVSFIANEQQREACNARSRRENDK